MNSNSSSYKEISYLKFAKPTKLSHIILANAQYYTLPNIQK